MRMHMRFALKYWVPLEFFILPVLAADIANSLMRVAPDVISEMVEVGSIKVVDYAEVPKAPQPPKTVQYAAIGGVAWNHVGRRISLAFILYGQYCEE